MVLDKKILRKKIIKMRLDLDDQSYHRLSHFIIEKLKKSDEFVHAKTIAVYLSYNHEVDTWQLIKDSIDTKQICVPVIQEDHRMDFVHIHNFHDLKKNKYGIYEPEYGQIIEKKDIDLIVVPLVGYSNDNYRLGYGGGYYDRYLENYKGQTIGLAFQLQKLDQYLPEDHDIALHKIITE